ncbi:MAG: DoxX family protein [Candidatus Gracilibacteria bacterium]
MNNSKFSLECTADWIMRIALALIFVTAGYKKLFILGPDKFAATVNIPVMLGWCAALGELGAGVGILAGGLMKSSKGKLITKASGAMVVLIMIAAFGLVKINGFSNGFLNGSGNVRSHRHNCHCPLLYAQIRS